ncbi:hypothetical protein [Prauserella cavernicola]|uniref:Ig-like domain-containing protein n=1 Tax=Prauserella cavernicola TaxID=2800127 RepID=A0A934QPJ1_9PSEU|nr:hypothetical protein [Prauserella cavernicola]MBK1783797.1 hypothetical protein [Prauserella cavernicola]
MTHKLTRTVRIGAGIAAAAALTVAGAGAANANETAEPDLTPMHVVTAEYPMEVKVTNANGDGIYYTQKPDSTRTFKTEPGGWTNVSFTVNGQLVNSWALTSTEDTFTCSAGGSAAEPEVTCVY